MSTARFVLLNLKYRALLQDLLSEMVTFNIQKEFGVEIELDELKDGRKILADGRMQPMGMDVVQRWKSAQDRWRAHMGTITSFRGRVTSHGTWRERR